MCKFHLISRYPVYTTVSQRPSQYTLKLLSCMLIISGKRGVLGSLYASAFTQIGYRLRVASFVMFSI